MNLIYERRDEHKRQELQMPRTLVTSNWVRTPDWSLVLYESGGGHDMADLHVRWWQFHYQGQLYWLILARSPSSNHGKQENPEYTSEYWLDSKENYSFLPAGWLDDLTEAVTFFKAHDSQSLESKPEPFSVTIKIGPLTSNEYADSVPVDPEQYSAKCTCRWDGQAVRRLDT